MLDLDDVKIPRARINKCIYNYDRDQLRTAMNDINNRGNIIYFIDELDSLMDKIPRQRLGLIASVMISLQGRFEGKIQRNIFSISAMPKAEMLVYRLMKKIDSFDERFETLKSAIVESDVYGLGTIGNLINKIELSYGRLDGENVNESDQIIELEQLEKLESIYVKKVEKLAKTNYMFDIKSYETVLHLWNAFDADGLSCYLNKLLENDISTLKFVCATARDAGDGWSFDWYFYSESISGGEIVELINKTVKTELDEFSDEELIKLASFVLNYGKDDIFYVPQDDARRLVEEWRN